MMNDFRSINNEIVKYYEISVSNINQFTSKCYKITNEEGNSFFVKKTIPNALEKYHFLSNQNVINVLFPLLNKENKYVTRKDTNAIYLNNYYDTFSVKPEIKANNLFKELVNLHDITSFKRQLNPLTSRAKFDEITNRLDYQFRMLEDYVRDVESQPLESYSMQILGNYSVILDTKNELVRLQKRIISYVKAKEGVDYSFIHNNPKIDHLLNIKGSYYLTSLENGKIGLGPLDLAKMYVENEYLNIDFKSLINNLYKNENNQFYYDYFRYLILLIYIRRMNITNMHHINGVVFVNTTNSLKRYFENFSDYQEEVS